MEYLEQVLKVLGIALVVAVIATNTANGIKSVMGIENDWVIKIMVLCIDGLFSYWMYFVVVGLSEIITYIVVLVLTFAGAETIYNIITKLKSYQPEADDGIELDNEEDEEEGE